MESPKQSALDLPGALRPCIAWTVLAAIVFAVFFTTGFSSIGPSIDGCSYSASARSILRGEGLVRGWSWPSEFITVTPGKPVEQAHAQGVEANYLWPLVLAFFFLIHGVSDKTTALACGFFFVATVPLLFLSGRQLFGQRAAHLAAALATFNAVLLSYTVTGLTESFFIFCLAGALFAASRSGGPAGAALYGLFAVAAGLTKTTGLLWVLPLGLLLLREKKGRCVRPAVAVAAIMLLTMASQDLVVQHLQIPKPPPPRQRIIETPPPTMDSTQAAPIVTKQGGLADSRSFVWVIDHVFGVAVFTHSPRFPDHSFGRGLNHPVPSQVVAESFDLYVLRAKQNLQMAAKAWFGTLTHPLLLALFWIGVLFFLVTRGKRLVVLAFLMCIGTALLPHLATYAWARYLHPGIVFAILIAAGLIDRGLDWLQHQKSRRVVAALVVLAGCFPLGFTAGIDRLIPVSDQSCLAVRAQDAEYFAKLGGLIQRQIAPHETVMCDVPAFASWYGDRPAVCLPNDVPTLDALLYRVNLDALLLTFQFPRSAFHDYWQQWIEDFAREPSHAKGMQFVRGVPTSRGAMYLFRFDLPYANQAGQAHSIQP